MHRNDRNLIVQYKVLWISSYWNIKTNDDSSGVKNSNLNHQNIVHIEPGLKQKQNNLVEKWLFNYHVQLKATYVGILMTKDVIMQIPCVT